MLNPQWSKAVIIKSSVRKGIVAVPLSTSVCIYVELNFTTPNGRQYGIIKKKLGQQEPEVLYGQ